MARTYADLTRLQQHRALLLTLVLAAPAAADQDTARAAERERIAEAHAYPAALRHTEVRAGEVDPGAGPDVGL
jgi:hypothetical protein